MRATHRDGTTVVYTPNNGFFGSDTFEYTVEDEPGIAVSATVNVEVSPFSPGMIASSGTYHTCVVRADDSLSRWGYNSSSQLGLGDYVDRATPQSVGSATDWRVVDGGDRQTCGIRGEGSLWCWGSGGDGQLGLGRSTSSQVPALVGSDLWVDVSTGDRHTCGVKTDGTLWCWGRNQNGEIGIDPASVSSSRVPLSVDANEDWTLTTSGNERSCGLRVGELCCWGSGYDVTPTCVGTDADWSFIELGETQLCGLKTDDALFCGAIGEVPAVVGTDSDGVQVATNQASHVCARKTNGTLWCWGENGLGQLGNGSTTDSSAPLPVGSDSDWAHVSAGQTATCAVKTNGELWCWGSNAWGELGIGGAWRPDPEVVTF